MSTNTKVESGKAKTDAKLSEEQQRQYIEVAAYHLAEKCGFDCSRDSENWLAAEAEIDQLLAEGKQG